jgi:hypothetical protein
MAVIVVIALIAIVLVYVGGNARTLDQLGRELKLVEKQQIRRLRGPAPVTNTVVGTNLSWTVSPPSANR